MSTDHLDQTLTPKLDLSNLVWFDLNAVYCPFHWCQDTFKEKTLNTFIVYLYFPLWEVFFIAFSFFSSFWSHTGRGSYYISVVFFRIHNTYPLWSLVKRKIINLNLINLLTVLNQVKIDFLVRKLHVKLEKKK